MMKTTPLSYFDNTLIYCSVKILTRKEVILNTLVQAAYCVIHRLRSQFTHGHIQSFPG